MPDRRIKPCFNFTDEIRKIRYYEHLLKKLQTVDVMVAGEVDGKTYTPEAWRDYESTALQRFSEVVSNLRNVNFIQEYSFVIERIILRIRRRQDEGKFVQAEKWNDLFNHYEITRVGLRHATDTNGSAEKS